MRRDDLATRALAWVLGRTRRLALTRSRKTETNPNPNPNLTLALTRTLTPTRGVPSLECAAKPTVCRIWFPWIDGTGVVCTDAPEVLRARVRVRVRVRARVPEVRPMLRPDRAAHPLQPLTPL